MLNDGQLRLKIESIFSKENKDTFLLGLEYYDDNEYQIIINEANKVLTYFINNNDMKKVNPINCNLLFVAFIEIAKRWKPKDNNIDYMDGLFKTIQSTLIPTDEMHEKEIYIKIYSAITQSVEEIGKSGFFTVKREEKEIKRYNYATLCAHAFAPKKNFFSFLDICYSIFFGELGGSYKSDNHVLEVVYKALKTRFNRKNESRISVGCSYLIKEDKRTSIMLLDRIFKNFNASVENYPIGKEKDYLDFLLDDFIEEESRLVNKERKRADESIKISYIFENEKIMLRLNQFYPSNSSVYDALINIYYGYHTKESRDLTPTESEVSIEEERFDITDKIFDGIDIEVEIMTNNEIIYNSHKDLYRKFLIFDSKTRKECQNDALPEGEYDLFIPNGDDIDSNDKSTGLKLRPPQGQYNIYHLWAKEGDFIKYKDKEIYFLNKNKNINEYFLINFKKDEKNIFEKYDERYDYITENIFIRFNNLNSIDSFTESDYYLAYNDSLKICIANLPTVDGKICLTANVEYGVTTKIKIYKKDGNGSFTLKETLNIIKFSKFEMKYDKKIYYSNCFNDKGEEINCHSGYVDVYYDLKDNNFSKHQKFDLHNECSFEFMQNSKLVLNFSPPVLSWRIKDKPDFDFCQGQRTFYYEKIENASILEIDGLDANDYKAFLEIDNGKEKEPILKPFSSGRNNDYPIGNASFNLANENNNSVSVFIIFNNIRYVICTIYLRPQFLKNPVFINDDLDVIFNPKSFMCKRENTSKFSLIFTKDEFLKKYDFTGFDLRIIDFSNYPEGRWSFKILYEDTERHVLDSLEVYKGTFVRGDERKEHFKKKVLRITKYSYWTKDNKIIYKDINSNYVIKDIEFIGEEEENSIYKGTIYEEFYGKFVNADTFNEDTINPIKIEMLNESNCILYYGYDESKEGEEDEFKSFVSVSNKTHDLTFTNDSKNIIYVNTFIYKVD